MEFPTGLFTGAPQLETRKALLVIDLQNDFVKPNGKLPVENVPESIPLIAKLVRRFREEGEIAWVQTQFHESQPTLDANTGSYGILLKEFLPENEESKRLEEDDNYPHISEPLGNAGSAATATDSSPDPEAFLEDGISRQKRCCLPETPGSQLVPELEAVVDYERDTISTKHNYGALAHNPLLLSLRIKMVTEIYLCGSLSNISVYATALEAVTQGLKVTIVEDCVGYRNERCHEEAMMQMADMMGAFGITSSELIDELNGILPEEDEEPISDDVLDLRLTEAVSNTASLTLGPRVEDWIAAIDNHKKEVNDKIGLESHDRDAVRQSHPELVDRHSKSNSDPLVHPLTEILNHSDSRISTSPPRKRSISEVDFFEPRNKVSVAPSQRTSIHLAEFDASWRNPGIHHAEVNDRNRSRQNERHTRSIAVPSNASLSIRTKSDFRPQGGGEVAERSNSSKIRSKSHRKPPLEPLGPSDVIGEGDCEILYDFIGEADLETEDLFSCLNNEVQWQKMYHRSGEVPRLVAVQGQIENDGSIPIYRHPADESPLLLALSKTVLTIRNAAEHAVGHPLNHVLIQLYRSGEDNISEHSDKTLDVVRGSKIVNYSVGARRNMTLRTKKGPGKTPSPFPTGPAAGSTRYYHLFQNPDAQGSAGHQRKTQTVPLPHNSLFILGPATNASWLHAIRPDKRPAVEKTEEELAFGGSRISLTFRHIGTWLDRHKRLIWGQGATAKEKSRAMPIIEGNQEKVEDMIYAFGEENHQAKDFDWEKWYGGGIDVVNFATEARGEDNG